MLTVQLIDMSYYKGYEIIWDETTGRWDVQPNDGTHIHTGFESKKDAEDFVDELIDILGDSA